MLCTCVLFKVNSEWIYFSVFADQLIHLSNLQSKGRDTFNMSKDLFGKFICS